MSGALNKGDRVRISRHNRLLHYQPGDTGTVWDKSHIVSGQTHYYSVVMDKDDPPQPILFTEDEIEPIGPALGPAPTGCSCSGGSSEFP